ncbi:MAG TPA: hypothetical protein VGT78_13935 [Rhizomicrobium sp.]|nr:hypothetical protein [Rhizomicrobium sp.]
MKIDVASINQALDNRTWDIGNKVLYDLCENYPDHKNESAIAAKIWLIGRSYAAAIERRRKGHEKENSGDDFYYNVVIPKIKESEIDDWITESKNEPIDQYKIALQTHKRLMALFNEISGQDKRSLASKYLHFHVPGKFFIFDSRAQRAVNDQVARFKSVPINTTCDPVYEHFFQKCLKHNEELSIAIGRKLTPREFDKILLAATK